MNSKKLYRSLTDRRVCGVCGGLAEYLHMDANVIRLLWVLLSVLGGGGLILYLIAALILPEEPAE